MKIRTTREVHADGVKALVYGMAGAGKTSLARTLPTPLILSAEAGLLSIADADLPFVEIDSAATLRQAYEWLASGADEWAHRSIMLDSISEIAEVVLADEKSKTKDPRKAYGEMQDQMATLIRLFRDLPGRNVVFTAKLDRSQDEGGRTLYAPSMPGSKTGQALPYFFDLVLALRVERDSDGKPYRVLQCQPDGIWSAKDRSGKLDAFESADLAGIFHKIQES
jgi:phage nucleotide-binding protein